jgi:hypothetical protein
MNDTSLWDWNLTCLNGVKDIRRLDGWSGREGGTRLAAKACEDAYDDAMAGKLFGMTRRLWPGGRASKAKRGDLARSQGEIKAKIPFRALEEEELRIARQFLGPITANALRRRHPQQNSESYCLCAAGNFALTASLDSK